jgi:2,3-bisphosphoglycerate-independent phosphoglycerate mutase
MKYVMIVPDGMADQPLAELNGRTPVMAARTPNMDTLAHEGFVGKVLTVPEGMYPGSDVANMALMGYDPIKHYSGRGPLEAAAIGVPLEPHDVAFRCSLVSTEGERLLDYSAGGIPTEDAHGLIELIEEKLSTSTIHFFPGVGYRHVMRWSQGPLETRCMPPHEIVGEPLQDNYPQGEGEEILRRLIQNSFEILEAHPMNRHRKEDGRPPANMIWFWGQGRKPNLQPFALRWGLTGGVIAAVDLIKGLGVLTGMEVPIVPGATGYVETDYRAKGDYALRLLAKHDFVYVHIEAPDEAGHQGDMEAKIWAIEQIDRHVINTVVEGLRKQNQAFRLMIVPDHATPVQVRTHTPGPVPFLLYDSTTPRRNDVPYDESILEEPSTPSIEEGYRLIETLIK